jgi:hypothetical protein
LLFVLLFGANANVCAALWCLPNTAADVGLADPNAASNPMLKISLADAVG